MTHAETESSLSAGRTVTLSKAALISSLHSGYCMILWMKNIFQMKENKGSSALFLGIYTLLKQALLLDWFRDWGI